MKTSALIPVVAYLGLAGLTSAAPVTVEAEKSLDKRTFCLFGFGWGCATPTSTTSSAAAAKTTAVSSVISSVAKQSAVTSSSAAASKSSSSAAIVPSSSAKASSVVAAPSSTSSATKPPATSSASKSASASWAQCTDFNWSAWNDKEWTWGGGFSREYVQNWYIAEYGLAPPPGMNWRQVSSLVSKFGAKTVGNGPKTTSKYTKGCSNPWTSAAPVTKTKAATTTTVKPVTPIPTSVKPATTSASASKASSVTVASSSSAAVSKPLASSASSAASAKASSSSAAVGGPAPSVAVGGSASPASSAASSPAASASSTSSAAGSPAVVSSVAPASSAAASPIASIPVVAGDAPSGSSVSSAAAQVGSPSPSPASPSSAAPVDGSNGGSSGTPGTGAGSPGTGAGSNNGTATSVEQPQATSVAPVTVNGFQYGGCAQEVAGRLLEKVQTSSATQSIESCTALCASYGFGVAGLEYGNECYCGTLDDVEDAEVSGECYMPCSGNSDQLCGGPNAINWYYDADLVPPTVNLPAGWSTYGVVTEGTQGQRLLSTLLYASQDNTVEKCAQGCASAGYKVAGTEYSAECFCGMGFTAAAGGGELVDDSAAFMACSGNLAQKCGGPSILSVTSAFGDEIPLI